MKIVKPEVSPLFLPPRDLAYGLVEQAGRTCYKSIRVPDDTPEKFIQRAIKRQHLSILEHVSLTLLVVCDRGVSHEIVRHRLSSYSQESTRYCNYSQERFEHEITVIEPAHREPGTLAYTIWMESCKNAEKAYFDLINLGETPEDARDVLPTDLKTEMAITMNVRSWRHFIEMRYLGVAGKPHPQMERVGRQVLDLLSLEYPAFFDDLKKDK